MIAFFRILYYYLGLSWSEKWALANKYVKGRKSPEAWLELFSRLNKLILLNPTSAYKFLTALLYLIIFLEVVYWFVAVLYFTRLTNDQDFGFEMSRYVVLLDVLAKVLLGVLVLVFFLRKWLKTWRVSTHVANFIIPLLVILREEVRKGSTIELAANLGNRMRRRNQQQTKYNYKVSIVYRLTWFLPYLWLLSIPLAIYYFIVYEPTIWGMSGEDLSGFSFTFQIVFFLILLFVVELFSPPYPRIITKMYSNEWLSFKVKLADKSVVNCQIVETLYEIKRKKKNPRGKIKTKTKNKSVENYVLKVNFPTSKYLPTGKGGEPAHSEEVQLTQPSTTYYPIKQKNKQKHKAQYPPVPNLQKFLATVGNAYRKIKKTTT